MDRFVGKVAIVTGASAGIGAAICQRLANEGLKVVGFARRVERIEELSKKCKKPIIGRKVDISKEEELVENIKWVTENVGPVHVLVNNAGIIIQGTLAEGDRNLFRKLFDTNVMGLITGCQEAIKVMEKHKIDGQIVNINSVFGHFHLTFPGTNVYPASKFAVTNATETLRRELAARQSKIKISSVSPGAVHTEIANNLELTPELIKMMSSMPMLTSEAVADAVAYVIGTPPSVHIADLIIRPVGEAQ